MKAAGRKEKVILERYRQGLASYDIARNLHVPVAAVESVLREAGIEPVTPASISEDESDMDSRDTSQEDKIVVPLLSPSYVRARV
jgi:hypothetical protein